MSGPFRCDGCGCLDPERTLRVSGRTVRYCHNCDGLRRHYGIMPEDHDQYRLRELTDQLAEQWGESDA